MNKKKWLKVCLRHSFVVRKTKRETPKTKKKKEVFIEFARFSLTCSTLVKRDRALESDVIRTFHKIHCNDMKAKSS